MPYQHNTNTAKAMTTKVAGSIYNNSSNVSDPGQNAEESLEADKKHTPEPSISWAS